MTTGETIRRPRATPVWRGNHAGGFAMLLVMMLIAMAVILGHTYLSSASIKQVSSNNLATAARAKYAAESGIEHALYAAQYDPRGIENIAGKQQGPFHIDGSADEYSFRIDSTATGGTYVVTAEGSVGGIRQSSRATLHVKCGATVTYDDALVVSAGSCTLPATTKVTGDVYVNGRLTNYGTVQGNATVTGDFQGSVNLITGSKTQVADPFRLPAIQWSDYVNYTIDGTTYNALSTNDESLNSSDRELRDGAPSDLNPGGVIVVNVRPGHKLNLRRNLRYTGTIVCNGDVVIDNPGICITAVEGFPALVVSGKVYVGNSSGATLNGLVIAEQGIVPEDVHHYTTHSATTINGGLVCSQTGYGPSLRGMHTLNYVADRCRVYNVSNSPRTVGSVEIVNWGE